MALFFSPREIYKSYYERRVSSVGRALGCRASRKTKMLAAL